MSEGENGQELVKQARKSLSKLIKGTGTLCVPARDDDDDFVVYRAINMLENLLNKEHTAFTRPSPDMDKVNSYVSELNREISQLHST